MEKEQPPAPADANGTLEGSLEKGKDARQPGVAPPYERIAQTEETLASKNTLNSESTFDKAEEPSVLTFLHGFFTDKTLAMEKLAKSFRDLTGEFGEPEQSQILPLIRELDHDLTRTAVLADFLVETGIRRPYRAQLFKFLPKVCSSLISTEHIAEEDLFSGWRRNGQHATGNLLKFFGERIDEAIKGLEKGTLPKKAQGNLFCIAACWLYNEGNITVIDLMAALNDGPLNLTGEKGYKIPDNAFGFLSSASRSSSKKRIAYLVEWVLLQDRQLRSELVAEQTTTARLQSTNLALARDLETTEDALENSETQKLNLEREIAELRSTVDSLLRKVSSLELHHGGEIDSMKATHRNTIKELNGILDLAETALKKQKHHIVEYQHELLRETMNRGDA